MLKPVRQLNKLERLKEKFEEVNLKHEIRKLRAKVKSLLPINVCPKQEKRNSLITKVQSTKDFNKSTLGHLWNISQSKDHKLFYDAKNSQRYYHVFGNLSKKQIQKIEEDRLYFLQQSHVQQFQFFIKTKDKNKKTIINKSVSFSKIPNGSNQYSTFNKDSQKIMHKKNNSELQLKKYTPSKFQTTLSVFSPFYNLRQKQTNLSDLSLSKKKAQVFKENQMEREKLKQKIQKKIQKAQQLKTRVNIQKLAKLSEQRRQEQRKQSQAKNKRLLRDQNGQIIDLTEKIRQICLRKSKVD